MPEMPEYEYYECGEDHQEPAVEVLIADLGDYLGVEWRLESYDDEGEEYFDLYMAGRPVLCGSPRAVLWQEVMALQSFCEEFDLNLTPKTDLKVSGSENTRVVATGSGAPA